MEATYIALGAVVLAAITLASQMRGKSLSIREHEEFAKNAKERMNELKAEYVQHVGTDLTVVNAARIAHNRESEELVEKDKLLIKYLAKHKHFTPFEHNTLTVIVHCPLYIRSQIHRHRTFSYNEVSRRYSADDIDFYIPPIEDLLIQSTMNKQGGDSALESELARKFNGDLRGWLLQGEYSYREWISKGVAKEIARAFLSVPLMTKFYMTGNLRNWNQFLILRLDAHAQKEVRVIAEQIEGIISNLWPVAYQALKENS